MKIRPRTNLNGGDLVWSTFLVLTFTFTLAFMATLALILAFLSPFVRKIRLQPLVARRAGNPIHK